MEWLKRHPVAGLMLLLAALSIVFMVRALWPPAGMVLGGHDMVGYYYPFYDAVREALRAGRLPLWEPNLFGGYPFIAQPQQSTFYPPSWINLLLPTNVGVSWYMIFHIWLAGVGMALFVRHMGARWLPALLAGVAFAFSGLLAGRLWAGHSAVYAVDAWTPWILLGLAWSVNRGTWTAALVASLPVGLAILAGHIPSFLYIAILWGAFALYLFLTEADRRWLVVRQTAIMGAAGLALAAVQLVPFVQFSLTSGRVAEADYAFATDYSLPPAHLITLLIPEFFGEPLRVGYWSVPTFEELSYYAGILAVLGIILAVRRPSRLTVFYLLVIVFGLWLALGRYGVLYELAYEFIPPFRLVRAPGRAAFFYLFASLALLAHVLSQWRDAPVAERQAGLRAYWPTTIAVVAIGLITALAATGAVFMAVHPTDTSGRLWHQIGGYSLALAVVLLGGGLIWLYLGLGSNAASPTSDLRISPSARRTLVGAGLVVLVAADMWFFAFKFVRLEPAVPDPVWTDAKTLLGDQVNGRILPWGIPIFSQNGAMQVGLPSVFGYDSLEPAAHIALASSVPDPRSTAYDVLGARYVLAGGPLDDYIDGDRPLTLIGQLGSAWLYERARPLPLARVVGAYEVIPDGAAAIARIHDPTFDPQATVILDTEPGCPVELGVATAEVLMHTPTNWQVRVISDAPALHVLAENDYPGWQVTVDGQPAPVLTAYTSMRAVCVPGGEHLVEWTYQPSVYWVGGIITLLMIALLVVTIILGWRARRLAGQQAARQ